MVLAPCPDRPLVALSTFDTVHLHRADIEKNRIMLPFFIR